MEIQQFLKQAGVALLATLFCAIFIVFVYTPESVVLNVNTEINNIEEMFGEEQKAEIIDSTNSMFDNFMPLVEFSTNYMIDPDREVKDNLTKFERNFYLNTQHSIETFWNLVYQFLLRVNIIWGVFSLLFVVIIAAIMDGIAVRMIKKSSFGFTSPLFYKYGFVIFFTTLSVTFILLSLPIEMPLVTYFGILFLIAFACRLVTGNMQKKF